MKMKLDICLAIPGLPFNGETFDKQSLGGSESAGYYMAKALAARGHRVTVFCSTEQRVHCADVDYIPIGMFKQYTAYSLHDVCIVQRMPELFASSCRSRFSALWCHDLALGRQGDKVRGTAWNYDKLLVLSEFMEKQYKQVYNLPDDFLFRTRNGIDLETVREVQRSLPPDTVRAPLALAYSARPERGLDVLLSEIMPRILKYEPQAKLFISAYHNPVEHLKEFYAHCDSLAKQLGNVVMNLGSLTKKQLYELYHTVGVYVYPIPSKEAPDFDEVSPVHGDTLIQTVSGPKRIRELEGKKGFYVYSRKDDGTLGASLVKGVWRTRRNAKVITLRFRPGRGRNAKKETTLTLTPDHEVMLRDGTYRKAGDLTVGDRVMAVSTHYSKRDGYQNLRITGELGRSGHQIVASSVLLGRELADGEVVHHRDGNTRNNEPVNLEVTNHSDHCKEHWSHKTPECCTAENRRRSASAKTIWNTPEGRASRSRSGSALWAKLNSLTAEERATWCKEREAKKTKHGSACKEVLSANGRKSRSRMWQRINALPLEERKAWLSARAQKIWEHRRGENHVVVAIESAPNADVFCMEVEPDHNFIANDVVVHNCISMMEAMACGLPIVSSDRGALPETLAPGAGILVSDTVHTESYYDAFAQATLRLMRSSKDWHAASEAGLARAEQLDWSGVAEQWEELFIREIKAKSTSLSTLANHFWRRSDIYAARECLKQLPEDDPKSKAVRERIKKDWAFLDEPDGFRQQYERIGATHNPVVLDWAKQEPRYAVVREWLRAHTNEVKNVLDYGCAHGAYATNLLAEVPEIRITGVDIDQHGIEMGYTFAEKLGVADRWRGVVGDKERLTDERVPEMREHYDVVFAQEVMEHVPDPAALLVALEQRVRDGGYVYITVPFGPWEYADYRRYPFRAHLWEFDLHDLYDLIEAPKGKAAEVQIHALSYGSSDDTDEPLGWWVVQYRVTPETRGKVGAIDMERKLAFQQPRQTVSLCMIAGPGSEEMLHWCLRSLVHVADEVVIADCGLSEESHRIIDSYRWGELSLQKAAKGPANCFLDIKVIPGCDPKAQGFETPRNLALQHCTQDWILWLDTDEKMLQPQNLAKYLRPNIFQGYSIRQHHFAVDTHFDPDLPVRLFRNNGKLRWFGMIHEHPESEINAGPGSTIVVGDVHIPHVGYLIESGRQQRFARNLPMLEADRKKYPSRLLQKHFIMRDQMLLCTYELQQNGGRVTSQMQARAREVVRLYREHFLGKGHMGNADPLTYYSQANSILGEGFDAVIQLSADKIDAKPNGVLKARFASSEDYMAEVTFRAKDAASRFESRYW